MTSHFVRGVCVERELISQDNIIVNTKKKYLQQNIIETLIKEFLTFKF